MRDVGLTPIAPRLLTVLPLLMVMAVIDQVMTHQRLFTLVLLSLLICTALISETLLGYARLDVARSLFAKSPPARKA